MKNKSYKILTGLALATVVNVAVADGQKKPESLVDKFSYTVGYQIGQGLKRDGAEINLGILTRAIKDVLENKEPALTIPEMKASAEELRKKILAKRSAAGEVAKKKGEEFLAKNKKKPGVTVLDNGLQYKILTKGTGKKPKVTDTIVAHYKGTLVDGKVFDSSYDRKQPATFGISNVIKGWQEILPMMPQGSKWQVFIPSDLAYGPGGKGGIGPGETLIFDIELLEIK